MTKPFAELTQQEIEQSVDECDLLAAKAYAAYAISAGGKNFQGNPMPAWAELPEAIRGHWRAAVGAVIEAI